MAHLSYVFRTLVLHFALHLHCWRRYIRKLVLRNEGDNVECIHTHFGYFFRNLWNMCVVDARNIDRINFDDHMPLYRLFNAL